MVNWAVNVMNESEFNDHVQIATSQGRLTVVEFLWGGAMASRFHSSISGEAANYFREVLFLRVSADHMKRFTEVSNVKSFPTFKFFRATRGGFFDEIVARDVALSPYYQLSLKDKT